MSTNWALHCIYLLWIRLLILSYILYAKITPNTIPCTCWLVDYPDAFVLSDNELNEYKRSCKIDFTKLGFKLSEKQVAALIEDFFVNDYPRFSKDGSQI